MNLQVEPGRIVGLLGPNGSGKTTLIKLANGLLTPSEGEILVCGSVPGRESHTSVSYLPERTAIPTDVRGAADGLYGDFTGISAGTRRRRCSSGWGSSPVRGSSR